jgi:hypothetical protein
MRSTQASLLLASDLALTTGLPLNSDYETNAADIIRLHKGDSSEDFPGAEP